MEQPKVTICPTLYAHGYAVNSWDDYRVTGGRYCKPQYKDMYSSMAKLRASKLQPIGEQ